METTYATSCPASSKADVSQAKRSFLRTMFSRMIDSRQWEANDAVIRHLTSSGGKFTDGTEFAIEQALSERSSTPFLR